MFSCLAILDTSVKLVWDSSTRPWTNSIVHQSIWIKSGHLSVSKPRRTTPTKMAKHPSSMLFKLWVSFSFNNIGSKFQYLETSVFHSPRNVRLIVCETWGKLNKLMSSKNNFIYFNLMQMVDKTGKCVTGECYIRTCRNTEEILIIQSHHNILPLNVLLHQHKARRKIASSTRNNSTVFSAFTFYYYYCYFFRDSTKF